MKRKTENNSPTKSKKRKPGERRKPELPEPDALALAEISSGVGRGERLNKELEKTLGIPLSFLTEKQWSEIAKGSGLPLHARFDINIALRRYWKSQLKQTIDPKTKPLIDNVTNGLEKLIADLGTISANEDIFKGLIIQFDKSAIEQRLVLETCRDWAAKAHGILVQATNRLKRRAGQPSYGPLYELIHELDHILFQYKGLRVTRSPNKIPGGYNTPPEFIWIVLKNAHLKVTKSTSDTILKFYISDRKQNRKFQ